MKRAVEEGVSEDLGPVEKKPKLNEVTQSPPIQKQFPSDVIQKAARFLTHRDLMALSHCCTEIHKTVWQSTTSLCFRNDNSVQLGPYLYVRICDY